LQDPGTIEIQLPAPDEPQVSEEEKSAADIQKAFGQSK